MELVNFGQLTAKELEIIRREKNRFEYFKRSRLAEIYSPTFIGYNSNTRSGRIFFTKEKESPLTRQILHSIFLERYSFLNLDLLNYSSIQYAFYSKGDKFEWHKDPVGDGGQLTRILTMSLNITNEDEYEGGSLLIRHNNQILELSKTPGSFITFPAFLSHKACEVTRGERESIVVWIMSTHKELGKLKEIYRSYYSD